MPSLWSRAKAWVNEHILNQPTTRYEPPAPEPPPFQQPPPFEPEPPVTPPEEPGGILDDNTPFSIYDDWGNYRGTYTEENWRHMAALPAGAFDSQFPDWHQLSLIDHIQEEVGEWTSWPKWSFQWYMFGPSEWEMWREEYAGNNPT